MVKRVEQVIPQDEHWFKSYWRPTAAWTYLIINIFDFIIAPVVVVVLKSKGADIPMWNSLTLQSGGLIHMAFGAIIGVSAYGRSQERMTFMEVNKPLNRNVTTRNGDNDNIYDR